MGTTYSFVHLEKVKTYSALKSKYNHILRKVDVDNADPEKAYLNETIEETPSKEDGTHMDFPEAVKDRINSQEYYNNRKVRNDAVLAFEVLLTFTKDDAVDLEKWKQISQKWLHDTFDVAPDGKSNIISIEYHGDETGNVHIHAIVCPIDEKGHLDAHRFTNGYRAMANLQTSYAEYMKPFGMNRGIAGSSASHKDIRKMYASLNNAKELPKINAGETAEQYRDRVKEELETRFAVTYRKAEDYAVESRQSADQYVNGVKEKLRNEIVRECEEKKLEIDLLKEEGKNVQEEIDSLTQQLLEIKHEFDQNKKMIEKAKEHDDFEEGVAIIQKEEPERAEQIMRGYSEAVVRAKKLSASIG